MRTPIALLALLAVAATPGQCGPVPGTDSSLVTDACVGKTCGDACVFDPPCRHATPPCELATGLGHCDLAGACILGEPPPPDLCLPPPSPDCAGKGCGAACVIDPPCRDFSPPCMVPSVVGYCDRDQAGACIPGIPPPGACLPPPPGDCAGKTCGDPCDPCGGLCMHPYASGCDRDGRCVPVTSWLCYDPCSGKACGAGCQLCPPGDTGCVENMIVKGCDAGGRCVPLPFVPACPP